jgi:Holliday junction resolvasome RuvABC ATP-dependent DNA helicase subunit
MFKDIIGQDRAKLAIKDWYLHEKQPLLIYGSSGFGKTMFAESLGARTIDTTQMRGDRLNSILKPIKESEDGDILFFDEIHSLQGKILEGLYKIIDKGTFTIQIYVWTYHYLRLDLYSRQTY